MSGLAPPAASAAADDDFLGLPFTRLEMAQALAAIACASRAGEWRYVVTPNAAHLARLSRADPALAQIYRDAAYCLLDSRVIAAIASLTGLRPPPVIPGSDLTDLLFRCAIKPTTPTCIVGGGDLAIERIRTRFGLRRVLHMNPSFGFWRDEAEMARTVAFIVTSQADYTFLSVGSPQQEILAARVAAAGGGRGVGICAGASIDFVAGARKRAPLILQRMALEWAHRLVMEPRRLSHRYLVESPRAVPLVLRHVVWRYLRNGRVSRRGSETGGE